MPLINIDKYEEQSSGGDYLKSLFWKLTINAELGSKRKKMEVEINGKKKEISGRYEDGWFLGRFKDAVLIAVHKMRDSKDWYLCNRSFAAEGERKECPICNEYFLDKKNCRFESMAQRLLLPFLATRRQHEPHIHKSKFKITPIYWFELNVTSYREDAQANYFRFRDANERHKISKTPYRVFAKDRPEKEIQEYYFKALKESDDHEIIVDHPIIDEWLDPKTGKWLFNRDYQEMLSALAIARYKPYVSPTTQEVFDYGGEYDKAMEVFAEVLERYGEVKIPLEDGEYEEQYDDDEELED